MDLVSIIVPIYKVEPYLDRCVRSIVDQTYENLEIILVDDGSPDNCPAICDTWAEKDSRVKVIHKENGGLSDARNAGLAVATGEYVSFIDSDDYIAPDFIAKLYEAIVKTGAEVAECATDYVDGNGTVLRLRNAADVAEMGKIEALRRLVQENGVYQTVWNKLYRREVIAGIPFAVGKLNEDEFWTWQVLDRVEKLAIVPEALYHYLQRGGSIIGVGYNIRRLDGLDARLQRTQYLQKYPELAILTRQELMGSCMWHYQSAKYHLTGTEQAEALKRIRQVMKSCPSVPWGVLTGKLTHKVWYILFRLMPDLTVWVRGKIWIS